MIPFVVKVLHMLFCPCAARSFVPILRSYLRENIFMSIIVVIKDGYLLIAKVYFKEN